MDNFDFFLTNTKRIKSDRKDNSRSMWFFFTKTLCNSASNDQRILCNIDSKDIHSEY